MGDGGEGAYGERQRERERGGEGDAKHADPNQTNQWCLVIKLHQEYAPLDFEGKPGDVLTACSVRDAQR